MTTLLRFLGGVLFLLFLPAWPLFWLFCRWASRRCPQCGSKWRTELVGQWGGEDWKCHACGHYWVV